jgi:hypothetical protein
MSGGSFCGVGSPLGSPASPVVEVRGGEPQAAHDRSVRALDPVPFHVRGVDWLEVDRGEQGQQDGVEALVGELTVE